MNHPQHVEARRVAAAFVLGTRPLPPERFELDGLTVKVDGAPLGIVEAQRVTFLSLVILQSLGHQGVEEDQMRRMWSEPEYSKAREWVQTHLQDGIILDLIGATMEAENAV